MSRAASLAVALAACALGGCGLPVRSADLFLLTRTGAGTTLQLLVNDAGTIRCDGGHPRLLPDPLLLQARDLAESLDKDVQAHRRFPPVPGSVTHFKVKLAEGTLTFPDRAAAGHKELSQAEQFTLRAAAGPCAGARGA